MLIRGWFKWQIHDLNPALVTPKGFTTAQLCLLQEAFYSDSYCRSFLPPNLALFRVSPHLIGAVFSQVSA